MKHIYFKDGKLYLLDQRKLPFVKEYVECSSIHDVAKCIKDMVVKGCSSYWGCSWHMDGNGAFGRF